MRQVALSLRKWVGPTWGSRLPVWPWDPSVKDPSRESLDSEHGCWEVPWRSLRTLRLKKKVWLSQGPTATKGRASTQQHPTFRSFYCRASPPQPGPWVFKETRKIWRYADWTEGGMSAILPENSSLTTRTRNTHCENLQSTEGSLFNWCNDKAWDLWETPLRCGWLDSQGDF